jgi:hypothetical protein
LRGFCRTPVGRRSNHASSGRKTAHRGIDFSHEQGFTPEKANVEELFAEQLRDL